jgi:hypothetical protein
VKYIAVVNTLAQQLTAAAASAATQDQDAAARVYGVKGPPGDVASTRHLAPPRRRTRRRPRPTFGFGDLLASAVRSGDDVPAHAVAECAITSGDVDTTNAFADAYPDLSDVVQRLGSAEHRRTKTTDVTTALVCRRTQTIGRRRPRRGMSSALRLEPDDT